MEGKLKEIVTFLEGNFAEKKKIGRKPYVPKVEALIILPANIVQILKLIVYDIDYID